MKVTYFFDWWRALNAALARHGQPEAKLGEARSFWGWRSNPTAGEVEPDEALIRKIIESRRNSEALACPTLN